MMKLLTKSLLLLTLLASCVKQQTVPVIEPCQVPKLGGVVLDTVPCGGLVCISIDTAVRLAIWMNDVIEYKRSIGLCPYVVISE